MNTGKQLKTIDAMTEEAYLLAVAIDRFAYEYDAHGYWENASDVEDNVKDIAHSFYTGESDKSRKVLQKIADVEERLYAFAAKELLRRLNEIEQKLQTNTKTSCSTNEPTN